LCVEVGMVMDKFNHQYGYALHILMTQMSAKKGLKLHGEKAAEVIIKEFKQLHDKDVFKPIFASSLTTNDKKKKLQAITLIKEKRNGKIKGRTVADGHAQRQYTNEDDAASPQYPLKH
jgi:hypothetical protein